MRKTRIIQFNKLLSAFEFPKWIHPRTRDENWETSKESVTDILEAVNGSYAALASLLSEDYERLRYHNSWNALMPLIQRINGINKVHYNDLETSDELISNIHKDLILGNIESTYVAVIKFVEWYNKKCKV